MMVSLLLLVALLAHSNANVCQFTLDGKLVDLTALTAINGSYTWNASCYKNTDQFPNNTYILEMQFCEPVKSRYKQCANVSKTSAINRIELPLHENSTCVSLGEYNVVSYDVTPSSQTGVTVNYYHGSYINHITAMSTAIYIECNPDVEMSGITYNHYRIANDTGGDETTGVLVGAQTHFELTSRHACHGSSNPNPVVRW